MSFLTRFPSTFCRRPTIFLHFTFATNTSRSLACSPFIPCHFQLQLSLDFPSSPTHPGNPSVYFSGILTAFLSYMHILFLGLRSSQPIHVGLLPNLHNFMHFGINYSFSKVVVHGGNKLSWDLLSFRILPTRLMNKLNSSLLKSGSLFCYLSSPDPPGSQTPSHWCRNDSYSQPSYF